MDEIYIEPDAGQSANIEVDDPGDFYLMALKWKEHVFIGGLSVFSCKKESGNSTT